MLSSAIEQASGLLTVSVTFFRGPENYFSMFASWYLHQNNIYKEVKNSEALESTQDSRNHPSYVTGNSPDFKRDTYLVTGVRYKKPSLLSPV